MTELYKQPTEYSRIKLLNEFLEQNDVLEDVLPTKWLENTDFFSAPASTRFHGAYHGGLFEHSMNVAKVLIKFTESGITHSWERPESPIIIGLLHDVTKIGAYVEKESMLCENEVVCCGFIRNPLWESFGGHGYDSVCKILREMYLTEEEKYCIRYHMGAYETDDWDAYDAAIKKYPNVLYTHTADMVASKLMEG